MKQFIVFLSFTLLFTLSVAEGLFHPAFAKKRIVRRTASSTIVSTDRLIIKPRLRSDRKALIVSFSNVGAVSSFTYELSYDAQGIPQGVSGTITPSGETSIQRELLFGTCSKNVCRYHSGISGMRFVVTSTLKSRIKVRKSFRITV